jgi:hypothetical protein
MFVGPLYCVDLEWNANAALVALLSSLAWHRRKLLTVVRECTAGSWNTQVPACYASWWPTLGCTSGAHRL